MSDKPDDNLEKEFAKHEFVSIVILTFLLLVAWIFSSDILNYAFESIKQNQYCYIVIILTLIITITMMRIFGRRVANIISKFWISKHKERHSEGE